MIDNEMRKTIVKATIIESKNVVWEKLKEAEKELREHITMVENITGDETSSEICDILSFSTTTCKRRIDDTLAGINVYGKEVVNVMRFYE